MPQCVAQRKEIKTEIQALLVARKEALTYGVPVTVLDQDYRELSGIRIPFRQLGYSSLLDLLQSMSDVITVRNRDGGSYVFLIVSQKSAHVSSLVERQKTAVKRPRGGYRRRPIRSTPFYPPVRPPPLRLDRKILSDIVRIARNRPNGIHRDEVLQYIRDRSNLTFDPEDLNLQLREVNHEVVVERDVIYPVSNYQPPARIPQTSANVVNSSSSNNNVVNSVNGNILLAGYSGSEEEDEDFTDYQQSAVSRTGNVNNKDYNDYERTDKREEEASRRNTQQVDNHETDKEKSGKVDNTQMGKEKTEEVDNSEDFEDFEDFCDQENIGNLVSERTRFRLEKLIQKHPEGIWCAELPEVYLKEYGFSLNYEELGFSSVSDYAANLPDIFHLVQLQAKGDFRIFDAKIQRPEVKPTERPGNKQSLASLYKIYSNYGEESQPLPVVVSHEAAVKLIPEGVMPIGETVPQICVTELNCKSTEHIDVVVVEIFTPSFFWLQLLERTPEFGRFMKDLHSFYESNGKKYLMPLIVMEKGFNCACKYEGFWHRAVIKSVRYDNTVSVLFYDYGTVRSYPPEDIHFLHRRFAALPAQAIPCGLYNIRPKNFDKWLHSVTAEFTHKVLERALAATVAVVDTDNNSMLVGLTNTEDEEDFHVNDWMVQRGFAEYGKMGDTVDMNDTSLCDPCYVDASTCQVLPEGVQKPPGLSYGGLDTIVEETNNSGSSNDTLLALRRLESEIAELRNQKEDREKLDAQIAELRRQNEELLRWKNKIDVLAIGSETSHQISQPPPIPPMPNLTVYPNNYGPTNHPFFSENNNRIGEVSSINNNNLFTFGKRDVNMNCPKATDSDDIYKTLPGLNFGFDSQNATKPNFNFSSFQPPKVSSSFCFNGNLSGNSKISQFEAPKNEPTSRMKFEESLQNTVKNFLDKSEKRSREKLSTFTSSLPDSNPFKIDLDKNDNCEKSRDKIPPPLPPPRPKAGAMNKKPRDDLMANKADDHKTFSPAVYEASPVMYDLSGKATNGSSGSASASFKKQVVQSNPVNFASYFDNYSQNASNFVKKVNETPEESNPRMFNGSSSAGTWKGLNPNESATLNVSKNVKTTSRNPPPLPPRPVDKLAFDFNKLSLQDQRSYTDWLKAVEYTDRFANQESLATNGWEWKKGNEEGAVGYDRTAASNTKQESFDRVKEGKIEKASMADSSMIRVLQAELDEDVCRFKAFELSNRTVHIFQLDSEGWLATDEFAATFTTLHSLTMINVLKTMGVIVNYRTLSRTENLRLFEKLDRTSLAVSRDENNKIRDNLHLTPLRCIFRILRKLKILTTEEIQRAMKEEVYPEKSNVLANAIMVVQEYKRFQQSMESSSDISGSM